MFCRSLQIASLYRRRLLRTSLLTPGFPNIFLGLQTPLKASKIPFVPAKTPTIYIGGINGGIALGFQEVREDLEGLRTLDPKIRVDLQSIEYGFVGSGSSNEGIDALRGLVGS